MWNVLSTLYNGAHDASSLFRFTVPPVKARVVILSAFVRPFRSGAEACVEEVAVRLASSYDVVIVTARLRRNLPKIDELDGLPLVRVGLGLPIDKWLFPFLGAFTARQLKPDLIHAVLESYAGLALSFAQWLVPWAKRLLTLQSTNTSLLLGPIHRAPHRITAISQVLVDRAVALGRTDVRIIPNGIPLQILAEARERWPKVPGRILFAGRLEPMKGVDTVLRSFAAVMDERRVEDMGHASGSRGKHKVHRSSPTVHPELHVVGHGSLKADLQKLTRELGIAKQVKFRGYLSGPFLAQEFAEAQIFCGLSRSEAFGNVFLEAQAAGCAVVATSIQGIPEVVPQAAGTLVAADDPEAAARAIRHFLQDADACAAAGQAGIQNAQHYDWSAIAAQYGRVYAETLALA